MIKKLLPIIVIAAAVMLFAILSWFGPASNPTAQYRPLLNLAFTYSESDRLQRQVAEDVIYRMQTHHQYRLANTDNAEVVAEVRVNIRREQEQLVLTATIHDNRSDNHSDNRDAAAGDSGATNEAQTIVVEGPTEVATMLSSQLFLLINSRLRELAITG